MAPFRSIRRLARSVRLQVVFGIALLAGVLALSYWNVSTQKIREHLMPYPGLIIHDTLRARLPAGGTVLAVSETCATCVARAKAFVGYARKGGDRLLLVVVDSSATAFRDLLRDDEAATRETMFVSQDDLASFIGIQAVPTYAKVDENGRVRDSGPTAVGWLRTTVDLRGWLHAWASILRSEDSTDLGGASP